MQISGINYNSKPAKYGPKQMIQVAPTRYAKTERPFYKKIY